jgi:AcrR family transcriptional regulator
MLQSRLLDTAIIQFGLYGFDGASTRAIAKASETAMSSITYHFGGKEGLYLAAAEHIAAQVRERLEPLRQRIEALAATATRAEAVELLLAIIDRQAEVLLSPETEAWSRFIVREQQQPTEAFERIFEGALKPLIELILLLITRARPDLASGERRAMAILLFGQPLILRIGRATVSRVLETAELGAGEGALLRSRLRKNVLCILSEEADG